MKFIKLFSGGDIIDDIDLDDDAYPRLRRNVLTYTYDCSTHTEELNKLIASRRRIIQQPIESSKQEVDMPWKSAPWNQ